MANNKIQLRDGTTLLDVSADTVTAASLAGGMTAHDASGAQITGIGKIFSFDANGFFTYPADVVVPNTVTQISSGTAAFQAHAEIKTITFETGSDISAIYGAAFRNCTGLEEITFQDLRTLSPGVFQNCTGLKEIVFPSTLNNIAGSIFAGCTSLKKAVFRSVPASPAYVYTNSGNIFYQCTSLEDVVLPDGWNVNLVLSNGTANFTNVLTHDSMVAMIANLYDYSGGTAHTLTLGETNLARLSEAEKSVAAAKNWTLA